MAVLRATHGSEVTVTPQQGLHRYQYLFPHLADQDARSKPVDLSDLEYVECLKVIGTALSLTTGHCQFALPAVNLSRLPPAYTYFGQFVDHDMSAVVFSPRRKSSSVPRDSEFKPDDSALVSELERKSRPKTCESVLRLVKNFWPVPLDLQSLYGGGPDDPDDDIRAMYDGDVFRLSRAVNWSKSKLRRTMLEPRLVKQLNGFDIVRRNSEPLLADHRNDESLILSQLQCRMMMFHNAVIAKIPRGKERFRRARNLVKRHFHWIIINDFLPRILDRTELRRAVADARSNKLRKLQGVPVEFVVAAFRFGHSMIRQCYDFNVNFGSDSPFDSMAELSQLFALTSAGDLARDYPLPSHWVIEWERLLKPSKRQFFASGIDTYFANSMNGLQMPAGAAGYLRQIGSRNLVRGFMRRVPCGQALAEELELDGLPEDALRLTEDHVFGLSSTEKKMLRESRYTKISPAWYYFLCEAKHLNNGVRLGPVASAIIARSIVGLIQHQEENILERQWTPADSPMKNKENRPIRSLGDLLTSVS